MMLNDFLSALRAAPPDVGRAREMRAQIDWTSFTAASSPVHAVFASKGLGWDRGFDENKCDPRIVALDGMEDVIFEVLTWCVEHDRGDLLASAWVQECGSEHLKACGFPTEERYPLIEAVHHRFDRVGLLCVEAGAYPHRVVANAIGSEDEETAFGMATARKQHSTLAMMAAHMARVSAVRAIEEISAEDSRALGMF